MQALVSSILCLGVVLWIYHVRLSKGTRRLPTVLGLPWLGRFWGIPLHGTQSAHHFYEWSKKYGPIYAWNVFGETHVWISSDRIARDLLGAGGKKYADRPELPGALGIRSGSEFMPLMTYGDKWRRHRSFITGLMRESAFKRFNDVPLEETKLMLRRLLNQPDEWSAIAIMMSARTSSRLAFGSAEHAGRLLDVIPPLLYAVSPAGMLPNLIPQLQYLPALLSPWKQREAKRRKAMAAVFTSGMTEVEKAVAAGVAKPSWARTWLENPDISKLNAHEAAHAIGTISAVGIGTLASPVHTYILAMCYYPSLQPRIQEEIDRVCGDRMPEHSDLPSLPLLRAVCKECLRWRSSTPGGVPHVLTENDEYEGYFIPSGAIIHVNAIAVTRDETKYPDAENFRPERWIEPGWPTYQEPLAKYPTIQSDGAFGYGLRSCPGVPLIETEMYTAVGAVAWAFNVSPKRDGAGKESLPPWYKQSPWVISVPQAFPCEIQVRSEAKSQMIVEVAADITDGGVEDVGVKFNWGM